MVYVGPVARSTCPNGCACPHALTQHRYDEAAGRWFCTTDFCRSDSQCRAPQPPVPAE